MMRISSLFFYSLNRISSLVKIKCRGSRFICCLLVFLITIVLPTNSYSTDLNNIYNWNLPYWAPYPKIPSENKMLKSKVYLGRKLFYEKKLSGTGTMSCGSCHKPEKGFGDGSDISSGISGQRLLHNTPTLGNIAYIPIFTWSNPRSTNLEEHILLPLFKEEPVEMGMAKKKQKIIKFLVRDGEYKDLFNQSFPDSKDKVTIKNMVKALAAFVRTLISFNSPYDNFRFNKKYDALSEGAKRGEKLFFSEPFNCFQCHQAPFFTDNYTHQSLPFNEIAYHNTGLYNSGSNKKYEVRHAGLYQYTGRPNDFGKFRTPTLRNIELTGPYMHDGSVETLGEVLDIYARGGRLVKEGPHAGDGANNILKSKYVRGFNLSKGDKQDLIEFLKSLTDYTFINNTQFSDPS